MKKGIVAALLGAWLLVGTSTASQAMDGPRLAAGGARAFGGTRTFRAGPGFNRDHGFRAGGAFHRNSGFSSRIFIAPGVLWGPAFDPPYLLSPPPPVYILPDDPAPPRYWYYCEQSRTYYPYVRECPGGWMTVVPPSASGQ